MNKELIKNRKVVVAAGIVVLLLIFVGFFLLNSKNSPGQNNQSDALPTQIPIPTITPDSIGLTLEAGRTGKTVIVTVGETAGITAIEYELSYTSKGDIPRGAIGQLDLKKKPVKAEITLGTCSDVCHYDEDVTNIKIILKVTKDDGKVYQAEKTLDSLE